MSIEDLKADLETNMAQAKVLNAMSTIGDIAAHINNTMWPFLENVVAEQGEQAEDLLDMYHGSEDLLQPETGALFTAVILGAAGLIGELEKRLVQPTDAKLVGAIAEWRRLSEEAGHVLQEIVVIPEEDGEEADEEGDEDEEDDEDDETEEKH